MASIKLKGDTSGEVTIQAPAVAGTTTLNLPATSSTLATQNALGVRNLIINGDMNIAQRGTSSTGVTTSGYYTVDRWHTGLSSAGTWTQTQSTDVPTGQGFANSHKLTCTTANSSLAGGSFLAIQTLFEGQNLQHLKKGTSSAESITLSFWIKSNKTGTYIAEIYDNDNTRQISKSYTINAADTWEKKTITYEGDTTGTLDNDNAHSLDITLWIAAGTLFTTGTNEEWKSSSNANRAAGLTVNLADSTSNYINITGVQLEVGDTATPFEHRPYDMELARCQRYFQIFKGSDPVSNNYTRMGWAYINTSGSNALCYIPNKVSMRIPPSITASGSFTFYNGSFYSITTGNITVDGATTKDITGLNITGSGFPSAGTFVDLIINASSTTTFSISAEL